MYMVTVHAKFGQTKATLNEYTQDVTYSENTATLVAVPVHRWTSAWGILPPVVVTHMDIYRASSLEKTHMNTQCATITHTRF